MTFLIDRWYHHHKFLLPKKTVQTNDKINGISVHAPYSTESRMVPCRCFTIASGDNLDDLHIFQLIRPRLRTIGSRAQPGTAFYSVGKPLEEELVFHNSEKTYEMFISCFHAQSIK